jgi:ketosteroid isomerase-like protein
MQYGVWGTYNQRSSAALESKLMTSRVLFCVASLLALLASPPPPALAAAGPTAIEQEITRLEQTWNDAYGANDLPKYFGYYAENPILVFDNKRTTLADYRKMWTEATKTEPLVSARILDLKVLPDTSGDTAVASYELDVSTRHADGKTTLERAFETDVWFKQKGEWRVYVVHFSTSAAK